MIADSKVRFGLVGAGGIAQAYAQAFKESTAAKLVAVADVRPEAAEAIGQSLGCASFSSHRQMADSVDLDAVVVCTPPTSHGDVCVDLMDAGVHVLCEKPLAIDSITALQMIAASERNDVLFTMASKFRYADDVVHTKSLLQSGLLGDVILFENVFTARVDMSKRWNSNPAISGGGVLIDNGTHSVDIMRYLLGPLASLQAIEGRRVQNLAVEDTVRMFVQSTAGVMGSIDLSWSMNKEQPAYISIYGSQATVLVGWKESKYRRATDADWTVFGKGYNKFQAFRSQIDNFAKAIRGEEELRITPEDGLASVQVIESAYESLRQSRWQPVKSTIVDPLSCRAAEAVTLN